LRRAGEARLGDAVRRFRHASGHKIVRQGGPLSMKLRVQLGRVVVPARI
jgi:hypothetical protein